MTIKPTRKGQIKQIKISSVDKTNKYITTPSTCKTYINATATSAAVMAVPPIAALLTKPWLEPSAGVWSEAGPDVGAAGEAAVGEAAPGAGEGDITPAAGDTAGPGVGAWEDGAGDWVGGATVTGVGVAEGETVGAPIGGNCAVVEVATSATSRRSLISTDVEAIVRERERERCDM